MNSFSVTRISFGAVALVVLGLLIALVPLCLFPVCEAGIATASGGSVPMKCYWTARVSLGSGGLVAFAGVLLLLCAKHPFCLGVALMAIPAGLLVILAPTQLIGVCPGEQMACHMGTLPALSLLGGLVILVATGIAIRSGRAKATSPRPTLAKNNKGEQE